jgi:hypothetical protein
MDGDGFSIAGKPLQYSLNKRALSEKHPACDTLIQPKR